VTPTKPGDIRLPPKLLPSDGRFGCGPSKIRSEQMQSVMRQSETLLGTSHRQEPVRHLVSSIRDGLEELFGLPAGWEIVLGNGGATLFWDVATFGLIRRKSQHLVFGEFSAKFVIAAKSAPHLLDPQVIESKFGDHPVAVSGSDIDSYCFTHNETSTGVAMDIRRPVGSGDALVVVDATSAAGGLVWVPSEVDVYYFSPQKCFASEGGLWVAACSPRAIARIEELRGSGRWCPATLDLGIALDNSRSNQTLNTPSITTLLLLHEQIQWMLSNGGMRWCLERTRTSSMLLYKWAESQSFTQPFVVDPSKRSPVVGTIDLIGVEATQVNEVLRRHGIVDTESYRKLGRNQLRIAMFPSIEPHDVEQLTRCIDFIVERISS
jgi:phosphoserine aminotransferase